MTVYEDERYCCKKQERPLWNATSDGVDLTTVANRAFNFGLFNDLDAQLLALTFNRHT